jgi:mannose-1-phosphate guanylyltransferase
MTMLDETRQRLAGVVEDKHTVLMLSRKHRRFYADLAESRPPSLMVEQPASQGTGAAMAFALGRIRRTDRDAVVAFLPSDHYYSNVGAFRRAMAAAYRIASEQWDRLVLVGATPNRAEPDYGWIEPSKPIGNISAADHPAFAVNRFWEKPDPTAAAQLFQRQCLWNTFITVGTLDAYRRVFMATQPQLAGGMEAIEEASPRDEAAVVDREYQRMPLVSFSHDVLALAPELLAVVPLRASGWVDIGRPERLADVQSPAAISA